MHAFMMEMCSACMMRSVRAQARDASERMHALGRIGQPEDVSRALEFLLDPVNSFVTGAFLHVDGGLGSIAPARAGDSKSVKS